MACCDGECFPYIVSDTVTGGTPTTISSFPGSTFSGYITVINNTTAAISATATGGSVTPGSVTLGNTGVLTILNANTLELTNVGGTGTYIYNLISNANIPC